VLSAGTLAAQSIPGKKPANKMNIPGNAPQNAPENTPGPNSPGLDKKIPALRNSRLSRRQNIRLLVGGMVWAILGLLFIPHWVIHPITSQFHSHSGMPIWSLGILVSSGALFGLAMQSETAFARWINRHPWVSLVVILGIIAAWIVVFEKR
jgi:cation transport ATPase